jgi:hypothetical protein
MEEMGAHLDEDESIELAAQLMGFLSARKNLGIERIKNVWRLSRRPLSFEAARAYETRYAQIVC